MQHDDTTGIIVAVFLLLKLAAIALVLAFYSKPDPMPPDEEKPKEKPMNWRKVLVWIIGAVLLWLALLWAAYELRK